MSNRNHYNHHGNAPIPRIPLPSTAQLNTAIQIIEAHAPARLRPLARRLTWLRDRLDPLYLLEQEEARKREKEEEEEDEDEMEMEEVAMSLAKRGSRSRRVVPVEAIVPGQHRTSRESQEATLNLVPVTLSTISERRSSLEILGTTNCDSTGGSSQRASQVGVIDHQPSKTNSNHSSQDRLKFPQPERKDNTTISSRPSETMNSQPSTKKSDSGHGKRDQPEPEHMTVPTISEVHTIDSKTQPYPQERARLSHDLAEAVSTNNFKLWPVLHSTDSSSGETSPEYHKPLSKEEQGKKQEKMGEWKQKPERDISCRQRFQGKGGYEDEVEKRMLRSTEMFSPTLALFVGTGTVVPSREEVWEMVEKEDDDTSGSGTSGEYVDAVEGLGEVVEEKAKVKMREEIKKQKAGGQSRLLRRPTFKKEAVKGLDREVKNKAEVKESVNHKKQAEPLPQLAPELSNNEEMPLPMRRPALQYINTEPVKPAVRPTQNKREETIPQVLKDKRKARPGKKLDTSSKGLSETHESRDNVDNPAKPWTGRRPTLQYIDRDAEEMSHKKTIVETLDKARRTSSQGEKGKEKVKSVKKQLETLPLASKDKNKSMTQTTKDNEDKPAQPRLTRQPTLQYIESDSEDPAFAPPKPKP
ncbi:uncharacterized protein PAC_19969 [Phialocephala subalpina]|uniref:Uncharacterized protein n=1 Tax=Phialocephala subalpina TaxID=576137 RepID=A0A1L7XYG8_9HELO|nr:uncharacterized protein PAC_19969 [Phialocephala subalpina]